MLHSSFSYYYVILYFYQIVGGNMIEFLTQNILWWHWIILGFILIILEINTGTFLLLGLGFASLVVGILTTFLDLSFNTELLLWIILCVVSIVAWKMFIHDNNNSKSGQSDDNLDILGKVEEEILPHQRGKVRFNTPVLGSTFWSATADDKIEKGSTVAIIAVKGQLIEVEKITKN